MSTSTRAKRPARSRPSASNRRVLEHLDRCAANDTAILNEAGWGIGILTDTGTTIAELRDITLREAIAALKAWRTIESGGFEILPPQKGGVA